ncbi:MAG: hypothetical protein DIU67_008255 [Actinomycetes bacterium]|jgi:ABC-type Fe3+ transport system permease subunit|nr:MAG: hypothetical protein DIU67_09200 [Actinomycetota bacterium]
MDQTEQAPVWSGTVSGLIVRGFAALAGLALGAYLAWFAHLEATVDGLTRWTGGLVAVVVTGVAIAASWIFWAIRPNRVTVAVAGLVTVLPLVFAYIA